MNNPDLNQMVMAYAAVAKHVAALYVDGGMEIVSKYFADAVNTKDIEPQVLYMRILACVRAEAHPIPSVSYLTELMHQVAEQKVHVTDERSVLCRDMLTSISGDICNEIISSSMNAARTLAGALGCTLEVSAVASGPNDVDWKAIEPTSAGHLLH